MIIFKMTIILYYDIIPSPCSKWHVTNPNDMSNQKAALERIRYQGEALFLAASAMYQWNALILRFEHQSS